MDNAGPRAEGVVIRYARSHVGIVSNQVLLSKVELSVVQFVPENDSGHQECTQA